MINIDINNPTVDVNSPLETPVQPVYPIDDKAYGLSEEEFNDPNKIQVNIADGTCPLFILFGPPSCGKTMTLIRLTKFLNRKGFKVAPIRNFRPSRDSHYQQICDEYNKLVNFPNAAMSTDMISFMLVEVIKEGKRICQILEAPGEYYFDPENPNAQFPVYVQKIINCSNRKVWTIFVEPDWMDQSDRDNYVLKIAELKKSMRASDKTIFLFNKIDKTNYVISPGQVHLKHAIKGVADLYPGVFEPFKNVNPITSIFKQWNCEFVPFQTGSYTDAASGERMFIEGPIEYANMLWSTLAKYM